MKVSTRSVLMAGVATLTASAVAIGPSVQPPPPPAPAATVQMAADVQLLALQEQPPLLTVLLNSPLRLLGPAAPLGTLPPPPAPVTLPPPPAPGQFAIAPNIANTIDSIYVTVEPWVQYGFEVATAVVRWIPFVGWFAGFIMDGYFFGESLVASGVFNFTDWLRGDGGAVENLVDFGVDVGLAFVWLGLDLLNDFVPLPPFCCYPPRPPVQGPFLAAVEALMRPAETPGVGVETPASGLRALIDRVLNNLNANRDVDGAFKGGATLRSLIRNGIADIADLLGVPLSPPVSPQTGELERTAEINTVPSMVKTLFAQFNSALNSVQGRVAGGADVDEPQGGSLAEVTKTVRNLRNEIRANFNPTERRTEGAATNGVVRAQGEVRGAVAKAVNDVADAVRAGKPGKVTEEAAKAPTTVAKGFRDTARQVVKDARQAAKDAREAAKAKPADDE